jgi:uncharacterized protein with HEPN domain
MYRPSFVPPTLIPWQDIGRFRDLVVHRYRRLQLAKVWEIVTEDVATLKHQLEPLVPRPN